VTYRPRRVRKHTEEMISYNVLIPMRVREALDKMASPPSFVRDAIEAALSPPDKITSDLPTLVDIPVDKPGGVTPLDTSGDKTYAEGVQAACLIIARNARLNVKMASGGTMGEDIANRILKDLLD
jgi:hypothetical protein